ncbi:MAG: DNA polymerase III subunit delta [Chloroflexota bacterium]
MAGSRANWIYLFQGEDELSSREAVQGLVARMKDSPMGEFNVTFFDGEKLVLSELAGTCQTLPFMADKRLVVVTNLLSRLGEAGRDSPREESRRERAPRGSKKAILDGILEFLPTVPEFCRLVFLEEQLILERDPILQAIRNLGGFAKAHRLEEGGLAGWIRVRAGKIGCKMSAEAVEELAAAVGPSARLLNSEIQKLATYCGEETINREDVRSLVADARKANVFAMVDAIGLRQSETALRELRKLLSEGDHPLRITAMVVRQFRLLIQVKELSETGASPDEIARKAGAPFRSVGGLQRQARNFSFQQLERAYRQLLDYDIQVKTGAKEPEAALELLIADLLRAA